MTLDRILGVCASLITIVGWMTGFTTLERLAGAFHGSGAAGRPDAMSLVVLGVGMTALAISYLAVISLGWAQKHHATRFVVVGAWAVVAAVIFGLISEAIGGTNILRVLLFQGGVVGTHMGVTHLMIAVATLSVALPWFVAEAYGCPTCGRLRLRQQRRDFLESGESTKYLTDSEGRRVTRVSRYDRVRDHKECGFCGAQWWWDRTIDRGHHDY